MGRFTTPAILEMLYHFLWRVYEPFEFYLSDDNSDVISVPAGFITDLASVPRIFWTLLPPDGKYAKAAIIHDYLYDNALRTKKEADKTFLDGMTVPGVPKWKRTIMYWRCGCLAGETTTAANRRRNPLPINTVHRRSAFPALCQS